MAWRGGNTVALSAVDRVYLRRTFELAERGRGSTSPNPPVGAVLVRESSTLGEGFHRRQGEAHAEVNALDAAKRRGFDARGATLYVSLEPCAHTGATGPCAQAVIAAGIARVVIGTGDPNLRVNGAGIEALRAAGIAVEVADDLAARGLIEPFALAVGRSRPYLHLKMAASLDGFVGASPGSTWLTGERSREHVRELRASYDAVMVGAGTIRADDPLLSVRPPRSRARPYVRVVACEREPVSPDSRVFAGLPGYARTLVLAPAGSRKKFAVLEDVADVIYVGQDDARQLDLARALGALKARGIESVLCEGGPTLAGRLLAGGFVDRLDWLIAPRLLAGPAAVPALAGADAAARTERLSFDRVEALGEDLLLTAPLAKDDECSPV